MGKLFEIFILERINDHIDDRDILKDFQFGFRKYTSTTHALTTLTEKVIAGLNKKRATIAVSLDFEKAFDTVWQNGIIQKMVNEFGFSTYITRLTDSYLKGRSFSVSLEEIRSSQYQVTAGVPQGSVLGPVLYNIYMADMPEPTDGEMMITYADDILVTATHSRAKTAEKKLETYLNTLADYFSKWKLKLNVEKSCSFIFKGDKGRVYKNARKHIPAIKIRGQVIKNTDKLKYLGVLFQENLSYTRHIDYVLRKGMASFQVYNRILSKKEGLSKKVKLAIYRQVVRPTISYAFPVWSGISSHQMERVRILERKILSCCLGLKTRRTEQGGYVRPSCRKIYKESGMCRIDRFMVEIALKHLAAYSAHPNLKIREGYMTQEEFRHLLTSGGFLSPMSLLHLRDEGKLYDTNDRLIFYHRRFRTYDLLNTVYNVEQ